MKRGSKLDRAHQTLSAHHVRGWAGKKMKRNRDSREKEEGVYKGLLRTEISRSGIQKKEIELPAVRFSWGGKW